MSSSPSVRVTRQQIHEAVWELVAQQAGVDVSELRPGSRLSEDLGMDSLDVTEVVMELEERLGIHVPDDALPEGLTLGKVEDILAARAA
jgi:acyl carrier protein